MLAMLILVFFMPLVAVIHLIATIYFFKKGHYSSKSFTIKHLAVALAFPIAVMALITFEFLMNLSKNGIHVGTFLSVLFVYIFVLLIFAIPYLIHLTTAVKTP